MAKRGWFRMLLMIVILAALPGTHAQTDPRAGADVRACKRAWVLLGESKPEEALALLNITEPASTLGTAVCLTSLAKFQLSQQQEQGMDSLNQALLAFNETGSMFPAEEARAWLVLALATEDRRDLSGVETAFGRALGLQQRADPRDVADDYIDTTLEYALFLRARDRWESAVVQFEIGDKFLENTKITLPLELSHQYALQSGVALYQLGDRRGQPALIEKGQKKLNQALELAMRLPASQPALTRTQLHLAGVLRIQRQFDAARSLYAKALRSYERITPANPGLLSTIYNDWAVLERQSGRTELAIDIYEKQLRAIKQSSDSREFPEVATHFNLGTAWLALDNSQQAIKWFRSGYSIGVEDRNRLLTTGSEQEQFEGIRKLNIRTSLPATVAARGANQSEAAELLATILLDAKGRVTENLGELLARAKRPSGGNPSTLTAWQKAANAYTTVLNSTDPKNSMAARARLDIAFDRLRLSVVPQPTPARADLPKLLAAIPKDAVVLDYVLYRKYKPSDSTWELPGYGVIVLHQNQAPVFRHLGGWEQIDNRIQSVITALKVSEESLRELGTLLLGPIEGLLPLKQDSRIFIVPDGAVALAPFPALISAATGKAYGARYVFSQLGSARQLLRRETNVRAQSPPVAIAAPNYGAPGLAAFYGERKGSLDIARQFEDFFKLNGGRVLTGNGATELVVKGISSPLYVVISAHGTSRLPEMTKTFPPFSYEDGMATSWVALAGANQLSSGQGEDGRLTGTEIMGMTLEGTRLVFLPSCWTGTGELQTADTARSLALGFLLAGAESAVYSLRELEDDAGKELTQEFFANYVCGASAAESLSRAQRKLMNANVPVARWGFLSLVGDSVLPGENWAKGCQPSR